MKGKPSLVQKSILIFDSGSNLVAPGESRQNDEAPGESGQNDKRSPKEIITKR